MRIIPHNFNTVKLRPNVVRQGPVVNIMSRGTAEDAVNRRRQEIVTAALHLLDETGFEGLSLRRLATYLGMHAPGLYWYFDSKQALIDLMAKAILDEGIARIGGLGNDQPWDAWLVELACIIRRTLLARRDGARVVAGAFIFRTNAVNPIIELGLTTLEAAGFERQVALAGVWTVMRYATGIALDEQASPWHASGASRAPLGPPPIDAARWPRTADAMNHVFDGKPRDRERLFRWGATMIVNGMAGIRSAEGSS